MSRVMSHEYSTGMRYAWGVGRGSRRSKGMVMVKASVGLVVVGRGRGVLRSSVIVINVTVTYDMRLYILQLI